MERRSPTVIRTLLAASALAACLLCGCDGPAPAPIGDIRRLPSQAPTALMQPYFPEIAKSHVGLAFNFDPATGVTDPELLFSPTSEARWLLTYLGESPPPAAGDPIRLPIPMSQRVPLRNSLLSVELWLAHVESIYVNNYIASQHTGAKLRYSPWVERHGPPAWKMGFPPTEPLTQPRLIVANGIFVPTGNTLDLALRSPAGKVAFFGVVNDLGALTGLTRDGRLYLDADRQLSSRYGPLAGLRNAVIPTDAADLVADTAGILRGVAGSEEKTAFSFGPVKIYLLNETTVDGLTELDGLYNLPVQPLADPLVPAETPGTLLIGRREQSTWPAEWFYRQLRSVSEARALVHTALTRLDDALILDQTATPPPRIVVKPDVTPFQKIFQEWADTQSGAKRRPPLRFRHERRMILSRAFFTARKAPLRDDGDDILLEFPPPDPNTNRTADEQMAQLLSGCAKYLRARMTVAADNLAHIYDIVEPVQIGAEKKPRPDRAPRVVSLDENTGAFEVVPMEKPFRTRVIPGNPNAIDAQGTVYYPNVNAADAIAEYRNLESEYKFILKALAVVQPELILEEAPPLTIPAKPVDWTE